jgi:hypothetical protein
MPATRRFENATITRTSTLPGELYDINYVVDVWRFHSLDYEYDFHATYKFADNGSDFWIRILYFGMKITDEPE